MIVPLPVFGCNISIIILLPDGETILIDDKDAFRSILILNSVTKVFLQLIDFSLVLLEGLLK